MKKPLQISLLFVHYTLIVVIIAGADGFLKIQKRNGWTLFSSRE